MDTQQVEIVGYNALVTSLVRSGIEVAAPLRDRGVDLIAYTDTGTTFDAMTGALEIGPVFMWS